MYISISGYMTGDNNAILNAHIRTFLQYPMLSNRNITWMNRGSSVAKLVVTVVLLLIIP